jgi:DNA-binding LacI/PurR family transcriptional regulator
MREMGRQATRMLLRAIADPAAPQERIELPTDLVIRSTCRALPG